MSASPAAPTPHRRILVGEDTPDIALFIRGVLEHAGYAVEVAETGEACLEAARTHPPDLMVLDLMLPRMHGMEVLQALKDDPATAEIGILVCTARDYPGELAGARAAGAWGVLVKPFRAAELLERVAAYFDGGTEDGSAESHPPRKASGSGDPFLPEPDPLRPSLTLWGTRGSIPTPGAAFLRHGGNTSCLSLSFGDECLIFDAGSGIRELGLSLLNGPARKIHLFITHTHWDHIQGFPFFPPAYREGFEIHVYGMKGFGKDLESLFRGQLDRDYFPVQLETMRARIHFHHLEGSSMEVAGARVGWEFAEHPGATVGYRVEVGGRSVAWVPDNEFLLGHLGDPLGLDRSHWLVRPFEAFLRFLEETDLVIHEAQYTNEEYVERVRWGHSSIGNAALLMKLAGIPRWLVTHHDPLHDDPFLERKLNLTRQILERIRHDCRVDHAYDGMVVRV